jgi:hypothetical protein
MTGEIKKDKYVYDRRVGIRALAETPTSAKSARQNCLAM